MEKSRQTGNSFGVCWARIILLKVMAYFAPVSRFNALTKLEPRNKFRDLLAVQDVGIAWWSHSADIAKRSSLRVNDASNEHQGISASASSVHRAMASDTWWNVAKVQGVFLIRNCSPHPYIPGTLNNPCLMDVWLNNHFRRKDWKTLNHPIETTFQEWLFGF